MGRGAGPTGHAAAEVAALAGEEALSQQRGAGWAGLEVASMVGESGAVPGPEGQGRSHPSEGRKDRKFTCWGSLSFLTNPRMPAVGTLPFPAHLSGDSKPGSLTGGTGDLKAGMWVCGRGGGRKGWTERSFQDPNSSAMV